MLVTSSSSSPLSYSPTPEDERMFYVLSKPIVILIIWTRVFTFGTSLSDALWCLPLSPCALFSVFADYAGQKLCLSHLQVDPIDLPNLSVLLHVQGFWIKTFSGEKCWSNAMAIRRLLCSWRISGTSTGRVTKVLVVRDAALAPNGLC